MKLTRTQVLQGGLAALAASLALGGGAVVYGQTASTTPHVGPPFGPGMRAGAGAAVRPMAELGAGPAAGFGVASDALLNQLGMTADQLRAERQAGKSLAQIAQARGVSEDALVALLTGEHKAALDAAVTAGRLTQAQAEQALATMQARIATAVDRTEVGPPEWAGPTNGGLGLGMGRGFARGAAPGTVPGPGFGPPWSRQAQS